MFEWYCFYFIYVELMEEVDVFLMVILDIEFVDKMSYKEVFIMYLGVDLFIVCSDELLNVMEVLGIDIDILELFSDDVKL